MQLEQFDELVSLIYSTEQLVQILACIGLRKLLSREQNPPIQETVDRNLVPRFLQLAQHEDSPKLQFEAIWCLTNIASSESPFVLKMVEHNATSILLGILDTAVPLEVKEQVVWCLGNISGDNVRFRNHIIEQGAIRKIAALVHAAPPNTSYTRNTSWTLANFFKGKPSAPFEHLKQCIPTLCKVVMENGNPDILTDICWSFSYVTDEGGDERIQIFLEQPNFVPRLLQLMQHEQMVIAVPCLRTLGNILTASDQFAQIAIDQGALQLLLSLLDHPKKSIRKEVCWSVSNVTAGNPQQIQQCLDIGMLDKVIHMTINADMEERLESVWCVANAQAQATPEQVQAMVHKGSLQALGAIMDSQEPRPLTVALEGIAFVLKAGCSMSDEGGQNPMVLAVEQCGLIEKLEQLQFSKNQMIYEKTISLLDTYFTQDEDADLMSLVMASAPASSAPAASLWGDQSSQPSFNI